MRKLQILIFLIVFKGFSQADTARAVIIESRNESKVDTAFVDSYTDYEYGYSIKKPKWLKVDNQLNLSMWGGTFPAVHNIVNAVLIAGYKKDKFKNFKDFQRIYITGNNFGEVTLYSKNHIWYGRNEKDFKKIRKGVSSRVFTFFKNKIYHNQFVLIETSKAYLFINFCATPETYDENITKFNEFMKGLEIN